MALYIKGMRLPSKNFHYGVDNGLVTADGNFWSNSKEFGYLVRHDAIEVPSHGRLIDADALIKQMEQNFFAIEDKAEKELGFDETLRRGMQHAYGVCVDAVNDAPTVIEAEE